MERNVAVASAVLVVHLVALLDVYPVHLDGAPRLRRHDDFVRHDLSEEGQQGRAVLFRAETVLTSHEQSAELTRRRPIRSSHAVNAVRIRRRGFSREMRV